MRRAIAVLLACVLVAATAGCGSVTHFVFVSNPGGTISLSGFVTTVQLVITSGPGGTDVFITAVTLVNSGTAFNQNFCGDQRSQFPLNTFVTTTFTPGTTCGSFISVVIH